MWKKYIYIIISCFSLVFGAIIYLIYRENTYLSNFIELFAEVEKIRSMRPFPESSFINGYLCDYLWALSFTSALIHLFREEKLKCIVYIFVVLSGVLWEVLQLKAVVSGYADFADVLMYLTAVFTVVLINKKFEEKKI